MKIQNEKGIFAAIPSHLSLAFCYTSYYALLAKLDPYGFDSRVLTFISA